MIDSLNIMKELELESDSESNSDDVSDCDIHDASKIHEIFPDVKHIGAKSVVSKSYILHISATENSTPNVAVTLSNKSCHIFNLSDNEFAKIEEFREHKDTVIDCKFDKGNDNLVFTGSSDGTIKLWDLRSPNKSTITFRDTTTEDTSKKIFSCFDVSTNSRLLTAGTELFEGDAFILFWDIRKNNLLGGYWEAHTDDITQVKLHQDDMNKLMSGSTDGLINVYDLSENCEDDALIDTLNTESSVDKLDWFKENGKDCISCITHTSDLQLWRLEDASPYVHIKKADVSKGMKRSSEDYAYIANTHEVNGSLLLLAGSNGHDGQMLRALQVKNKTLKPAFKMVNNSQRVRCSSYNKTDLLFTAGEKGVLNAWTKIAENVTST